MHEDPSSAYMQRHITAKFDQGTFSSIIDLVLIFLGRLGGSLLSFLSFLCLPYPESPFIAAWISYSHQCFCISQQGLKAQQDLLVVF